MADKRTTITIEENLLKEAKRLALEEDKTLKEVIGEALEKKLLKPAEKRANKPKKFPFKAYHMGKIKGTLSREEIYDWL